MFLNWQIYLVFTVWPLANILHGKWGQTSTRFLWSAIYLLLYEFHCFYTYNFLHYFSSQTPLIFSLWYFIKHVHRNTHCHRNEQSQGPMLPFCSTRALCVTHHWTHKLCRRICSCWLRACEASDVIHSYVVTNLSSVGACVWSLLLPSSDSWPPLALRKGRKCDQDTSWKVTQRPESLLSFDSFTMVGY